MSRLKQYFKIIHTLVWRYTNPEYLHFLYYKHKFNKLVLFYMKRCNCANNAIYEAEKAFSRLYLFDYTRDGLDENFKCLLG